MVMPDRPQRDPYESTDVIVCPSCLTVNGEHQHFCRECGTPLTALSVIDPVGQIYATGDTYRKAMNRPSRMIVVIGTWLIFLPTILTGGVLPVVAAVDNMEWDRIDPSRVVFLFLSLMWGGACCAFFGSILYRVTRNYLRQQHEPAGAGPDDDEADDFSAIA